jgi:hypothetical protein
VESHFIHTICYLNVNVIRLSQGIILLSLEKDQIKIDYVHSDVTCTGNSFYAILFRAISLQRDLKINATFRIYAIIFAAIWHI